MVDRLSANTCALRLVSALSFKITQVNSSFSFTHLCGISLSLHRLFLPQKLVIKQVDRFRIKNIRNFINMIL